MSKPILLDGGCGSLLWALAEDARIEKVPTWIYNVEHPELVEKMTKLYMEAGSQMVQTNTFSANRPSVQHSSSYSVEEIVSAGVAIAKKVTSGTDVVPYLSVGPLTTLLKPYGALSKEDCASIYAEMFDAAYHGGITTVALETFLDLEMLKIVLEEAKKYQFTAFCSMTFGKKHRTIMGNSVSQIVSTLAPMGADAVGMNCSMDVVESLSVIEEYHETTTLPLYFKPNAGMATTYSAQQFAQEITPALEYVSYIGGCCGTDYNYIRELKGKIDTI